MFGVTGEPRTWFNTIPEATAPATANIPDGAAGMGGSALTNEYFDASWYELQMLLHSGNHRHRDRLPVDWVYLIGRFLDLNRESRRPEPARLLVAVIKAMQSTDPSIGPDNRAQGWRPSQNVDPTIMVSAVWAPIFQPFSGDIKRAITESSLRRGCTRTCSIPWRDILRLVYRSGVTPHRRVSEASLAAMCRNSRRYSRKPGSIPKSFDSLSGGERVSPRWLRAFSMPHAGPLETESRERARMAKSKKRMQAAGCGRAFEDPFDTHFLYPRFIWTQPAQVRDADH